MFLRFERTIAVWAVVVAALTSGLTGCSDVPHVVLDGGAGDATVVEAKSLEIVGDPTISLTSEQEATLTVRLRDAEGRPMAGSEVRFALDGRAHDSTLLEVSALTNAMGEASTTLRAGRVIAAFRVRASADDAASVSFDVAVGDAGFGSMQVTPSYEGNRETLPLVRVGVFTDATCEDEIVRRDAGDRVQVQSDDDELVRFLGLPVGPTYAVAVRGEGEDGVLLAWGCADGFEIVEMDSIDVTVPFDDEPLMVDGSYRTTTQFEMLETTGEITGLLEEQVDVLLPEIDATLILDVAEQQLIDAGETADAATLATARAGGYDSVYQGQLEDEEVGPSVAHQAFVERVAIVLTGVGIRGRIRVNEAEVTYEVLGLELTEGYLDARLAELELPAELTATATDQELTFESLSIGLSASELVRALATFEAYERVYSDGGDWLALEAGCGMLPAPTDAIGCDSECLRMACETVIDEYYAATLSALEPLDAQRATFELSGAADLSDTAGDLRVDSVDGTISGEWTGPTASSPETVEGAIVGQRITPPT